MTQDSLLELTRRNAELTARVAELTRALAQREAITVLTAGVMHDVRNALHVVVVAGETLSTSVEQADQIELADTILAAARHGASLSRDLLALARQEGARASVVDCAELLGGVRRLIERVMVGRVQCTFEIGGDVWPIMIERSQFEATLINLGANARDAMPDGGQLHIAARNLPPGLPLPEELPPGDYVEWSVVDTGSGMSPEVLARSTEAFFTTKQASGGTGLGLPLAQNFAARSGGSLLIDSAPNRGTRIRILLPRAWVRSEAAVVSAGLHEKVERLLQRIRTPELRRALESWQALCPPEGLPAPIATEAKLAEQAEWSLVLGVEDGSEPRLRLLRIGDSLARALGRTELGELPIHGSLAVGTLGAAYRRAFHSGFPSYEYLNYDFKDAAPGIFERLILPAASDGETVSHLLGVVRLSENLELGGRDDHVP
ncbi:MAG TPA: ATP-binding protein [Polyangiales bacterium]|nr:ATP-binding protein [Polyangiales bacterium]